MCFRWKLRIFTLVFLNLCSSRHFCVQYYYFMLLCFSIIPHGLRIWLPSTSTPSASMSNSVTVRLVHSLVWINTGELWHILFYNFDNIILAHPTNSLECAFVGEAVLWLLWFFLVFAQWEVWPVFLFTIYYWLCFNGHVSLPEYLCLVLTVKNGIALC